MSSVPILSWNCVGTQSNGNIRSYTREKETLTFYLHAFEKWGKLQHFDPFLHQIIQCSDLDSVFQPHLRSKQEHLNLASGVIL